MGARPSGFKQGGGFLNNVDATFEKIIFTTEPEAFDGKKSKKKGSEDFTALYAEVTFAVDGDDEPKTTTLFVGDADIFEIEEDGEVLTPVNEGDSLRGGTPFAKLIASLVEAGFPETALPDDDEPITYSAVYGTRVRLVQKVDEEATKRLGKKKSKDGKKEYNRTDVVVEKVYSLPDGKGSAKSASSSKSDKKGGKAKEFDLDEASAEVLIGLLNDAKDNTLQKAQLPNLLVKALKKDNPNREDIRRRVYSDDFLETENGWSYDASSKKQLIKLKSEDDE